MLPEILDLFQTKICDFPYPISDLIKNLIPYFSTGTTQWKFIRIGQNIQTEAEVLVERSIFVDVFYHLVTCRKLNGSREENMHCSLWNENDQKCRQRVKVLFPGFLSTVVI